MKPSGQRRLRNPPAKTQPPEGRAKLDREGPPFGLRLVERFRWQLEIQIRDNIPVTAQASTTRVDSLHKRARSANDDVAWLDMGKFHVILRRTRSGCSHPS